MILSASKDAMLQAWRLGMRKVSYNSNLNIPTRSSAVADKPPDACAGQCCAVKSCPLVNDCDYWPDFPTYLPLSHLMPSMREIPSSYRVHIWYGKTRTLRLQSGEGRMMIDSVVGAQYINVTDTHAYTDSQCRANPLESGGKNVDIPIEFAEQIFSHYKYFKTRRNQYRPTLWKPFNRILHVFNKSLTLPCTQRK